MRLIEHIPRVWLKRMRIVYVLWAALMEEVFQSRDCFWKYYPYYCGSSMKTANLLTKVHSRCQGAKRCAIPYGTVLFKGHLFSFFLCGWSWNSWELFANRFYLHLLLGMMFFSMLVHVLPSCYLDFWIRCILHPYPMVMRCT